MAKRGDFIPFLSSAELKFSKEDIDKYANKIVEARVPSLQELMKANLQDLIAIGIPYWHAKQLEELIKRTSESL